MNGISTICMSDVLSCNDHGRTISICIVVYIVSIKNSLDDSIALVVCKSKDINKAFVLNYEADRN